MTISKGEAAQALSDIEGARLRTQSMQVYRRAAPYFVLWGCIWVLANCLVYLAPAHAAQSWGYLSVTGVALTLWLSIRAVRRGAAAAERPVSTKSHYWQIMAAWLVVLGYFIANFALLPHLNGRQGNAFISMFWAFLYAFLGIYLGWRLLAIGLATALSILIGYFLITSYYFLWMGLVSGSLLIMGGLWLRKV